MGYRILSQNSSPTPSAIKPVAKTELMGEDPSGADEPVCEWRLTIELDGVLGEPAGLLHGLPPVVSL
jgi:hypothetical protein